MKGTVGHLVQPPSVCVAQALNQGIVTTTGVARIFVRGVLKYNAVKPHGGVAAHGQLAGHRGWVREGDVPPPAEGGGSC